MMTGNASDQKVCLVCYDSCLASHIYGSWRIVVVDIYIYIYFLMDMDVWIWIFIEWTFLKVHSKGKCEINKNSENSMDKH